MTSTPPDEGYKVSSNAVSDGGGFQQMLALVTAFGKGVFIAVLLIKKSEYIPKAAMDAIPLTTAPRRS